MTRKNSSGRGAAQRRIVSITTKVVREKKATTMRISADDFRTLTKQPRYEKHQEGGTK